MQVAERGMHAGWAQALNVKPQYAYFINLIYGGAAILSFLSCLMCAPHQKSKICSSVMTIRL